MDDQTVRVEDYLNDKIQTAGDLENINLLLQNVRNQQALLRKQLSDSEDEYSEAQKAAAQYKSTITQKANLFNGKQEDIDKRLLELTDVHEVDDAARQLEEVMQKLRNLDVALGYIELLKEMDALSGEARERIKESPAAALKPYSRLQHIGSALKTLQPAAEGAAPHLVDHAEKMSGVLWRQMRDTLSKEFEEALKKMSWPTRNMNLASGIVRAWEEGVKKLLQLQEPELMAHERQPRSPTAPYDPLVLLPLEVMIEPLELRFRYHFDGERPTNRLDKPEYFLAHIIDLLNTYAPFFASHLQRILQDFFGGTELADVPAYSDSTSALITSLLPMLRKKIFATLPRIASQPQLLSHFIHEVISFDTTLRDEWAYSPAKADGEWKGLTWEILVAKDWFGRWLQVEKDFALSRYTRIIEARDAGEIDYDSVEPSRTKPTKAAVRVNDLLEQVTNRYRPLVSFSQKLRFLIDIQIAIFDQFHSWLYAGLEAYLAASSAVVRAVQGTKDDKASVEGLRGLERLCRIYGSAEYLEKAMEDWGDDVFFLELWETLQTRARGNRDKTLTGSLTVEDVAGRTSSAVGSDGDSGALFDETASAYRILRVRTEELLIDFLKRSLKDALRPYSRINTWPSLDSDSVDQSEASISPELDGLLEQLDSFLSFLSRVLARAPLRHISRQICLFMQSYLWDYVVMRQNFSENGAVQFCRDLAAVWQVMDKYLGEGQAELGMRKLKEAAVLLSLPKRVVGEDQLGLEEAEEEIFESNEKAREVLDKLGLDVLTETEARNIMERRVDLLS